MTKTTGAFASENASLKLAYLAFMKAIEKWLTMVRNRNMALQKLVIVFEDRIKLDLI